MCASESQDLEPSAGPAAVPHPTTSSTTPLTSSLPATKGHVQQRAADIHRQLEVRTELPVTCSSGVGSSRPSSSSRSRRRSHMYTQLIPEPQKCHILDRQVSK